MRRTHWLPVMVVLVGSAACDLTGLALQTQQRLEVGPDESFEVDVIKPARADDPERGFSQMLPRLSIENLSVWEIIKLAYNLHSDLELEGGPTWIRKSRFNINAKMSDQQFVTVHQLSPAKQHEQTLLMLQSLLRNRFHLRMSRTNKELPGFALVVARGGSRLVASSSSPDASSSAPSEDEGSVGVWRGKLVGQDVSIRALAAAFTQQIPDIAGRTIVDESGLKGRYSFTLEWSADTSEDLGVTLKPAFATALKEQLGLELKPRRIPEDVLVIDEVELPSEN